MATLSGQTIQSTYQGLIKLQTSTTGITSTLQTIEDGLGNPTTIKVSTGRTNIDNFYSYQNLKPRFTGNGKSNASQAQQASGNQNILQAFPFFDSGIHSYSALTYGVSTITSTSDVVELAFYTPQTGVNGLVPFERVGSVQTLTGLTSATEQTIPFSGGNISFSATGSGVYFMVYKYSNAGVQPTLRLNSQVVSPLITSFESSTLGLVQSFLTNNYSVGFRFNGLNRMVFTGASTFDSSFSYSTISSAQSTTSSVVGGVFGFNLHVNDY